MPVPVQVSLSADTLFVTHHHPVLPKQILQHLTAGVAHRLQHLGSFKRFKAPNKATLCTECPFCAQSCFF